MCIICGARLNSTDCRLHIIDFYSLSFCTDLFRKPVPLIYRPLYSERGGSILQILEHVLAFFGSLMLTRFAVLEASSLKRAIRRLRQ
jgi:hypothetical protein